MPAGKARVKELVDAYLHGGATTTGDLQVEVADRSAATGVRTIAGTEIAGAHGGFLDLRGGGRVPFHRVRAIRVGGRVVYARDPPRPSSPRPPPRRGRPGPSR